MSRKPELARRFYDRFEPVHAVAYFAPQARAALDALGYRGFWMGYFAARSAPLGVVPTDVVTAIFYNFAPERVAKALPAAWQIAGPDAAWRARQESAVAALRRYGIREDENVSVAAALAGRAAHQAPLDGRPLFAANLALPWPNDPLAALWHATTLLREQRGDAHVAVLAAAGVSGRESNVLHAAAGGVPRDYIARTRDYDETTPSAHTGPPFVPGSESAEIVAEVGADVTEVAVGDRILTVCGVGAFADEVVVTPSLQQVHVIPDDMTFTQAAGFGMVHGTALHGLRQRGGLQRAATTAP